MILVATPNERRRLKYCLCFAIIIWETSFFPPPPPPPPPFFFFFHVMAVIEECLLLYEVSVEELQRSSIMFNSHGVWTFSRMSSQTLMRARRCSPWSSRSTQSFQPGFPPAPRWMWFPPPFNARRRMLLLALCREHGRCSRRSRYSCTLAVNILKNIIIMYIYRALINAPSAHIVHINLNIHETGRNRSQH